MLDNENSISTSFLKLKVTSSLGGEEYKKYLRAIEDRLGAIITVIPLDRLELIKGTPSEERIQHNLGHFRFSVGDIILDECWICAKEA